MPLRTQCLDYRIRDWLPALLALGAVSVCVAINTPSVPVLFYKRGGAIKWVTALRAEEMANVPLSTASHYNLTLYRCFARFTARREELMEVQVAIEPHGFVAVFFLQTLHVL